MSSVGLDLGQYLGIGAHSRMRRHKQGATVLIRDDGDIIAPEGNRLCDDLLLIHADEGSKHGEIRYCIDGRQILQRLRRHLTYAFPCHQGFGVHTSR